MRFKFIIEQNDGYSIIQTVIPEPIGWKEAVFNIKRDKEIHGVFFQYVQSLRFYGAGYNLISAEYTLNGVDGEMRLIIQFACSETDDFESFYESKINFSMIEFDNSDVCLVSVPIEDDTALTMFLNRSNQKVDLASLESFDGDPLDNYAIPLNIELPPKTFVLNTDLVQQIGDEIHDWNDMYTVGAGISIFNAYSIRYFQIGYDTLNLEETLAVTNSFVELTDEAEVQPILVLERSGAYTFDVKLSYTFDFGGSGNNLELGDGSPASMDRYHVEVVLNINGNETLLADTGVVPGPFPENTSCTPPDSVLGVASYNIDFSPTLLMEAGDVIKLYVRVLFGALTVNNDTIINRDYHLCGRFTFHQDTIVHGNHFKVTLPTNNGTTLCDVALVNEALSRTAEAITNDRLRVYSEYFGRTDSLPYSTDEDGPGSLEALTNGLKIRQRLASLLFSFKEIYDGLNHIHNIGMGLEPDLNYGRPAGSELIRIEPARYFYNDEIILVLPLVPQVTRKVLAEEHYSIFNFGYFKWEAEEYNGLDEFATKREYRTSLKSVKNTLTKISNFIASGYAIEITKGKGRNTDDWRFDNDQFIICLLRTYGDFIVEQGNIGSPANIIDPDTVYNFRISPERNLLRWLWKILASYVDPTTGELIFMDGEGNYIAEGMLPDSVEGSVLSESESPVSIANIAVAADGLPLYIPEEWTFRYPMSVEDYRAVKANPRGIIQMKWGQNTNFNNFFIRSIEYKPVDGEAQFTLLPKYPFEDVVIGDSDILLQENGDAILQENGDFILLN